jgi:hypothetical protein
LATTATAATTDREIGDGLFMADIIEPKPSRIGNRVKVGDGVPPPKQWKQPPPPQSTKSNPLPDKKK